MLDRLSTLLGVDPRELSGTTVDVDLPLTPALINRKIAEYLTRADGKVSAVVVDPVPLLVVADGCVVTPPLTAQIYPCDEPLVCVIV